MRIQIYNSKGVATLKGNRKNFKNPQLNIIFRRVASVWCWRCNRPSRVGSILEFGGILIRVGEQHLLIKLSVALINFDPMHTTTVRQHQACSGGETLL
ncbi:Large ribosomal subunit protein [Trichinella spiralis]|uniref:Large ribosomal subunit protein n=1 Tax=Trichinella spiralis TaxID=6334 RepID=A0ABR3L181_TRISP